MNKLKKIIEEMPKEDLLKLKKDLVSGNLTNLLNKKLNQDFTLKHCPVCGDKISNEPYILEFGKQIRQIAFFDGADCLSYFVQVKLKNK